MSNVPAGHPSDAQLQAWLDGLPGSLNTLSGHINDCPTCQERLEQLTALDGNEVQQFSHQYEEEMPPELPGYPYVLDESGLARRLGDGGFGIVYLALSEERQQLVAIKWLRMAPNFQAEQRAGFMREAVAALSLQHPNIVQGYDTNACENRLYYVMEYVPPGRTLRGWQHDQPLLAGHPNRFVRIAELLEQLADALAYAHCNSLIHRDLSFLNILVEGTEDGLGLNQLKICDFGLARPVGSDEPNTPEGQRFGILPFMAPELFQLNPTINASIDIYALGAVGFYMLSGATPVPLGVHSLSTIYTGQLTSLRSVCPDVPPALETIVRKCLRTRPEDRYRTALEVREDLRRFRQSRRLLSWREPSIDRVHQWIRAYPWVASSMVTISLLLMIVFLVANLFRLEWQRADRNAQKALDASRDRLAASARAAVLRGDLAHAETFFDEAIDFASPDSVRDLELQRLQTLTPNGRWERLRTELDRLERCTDLSPSQQALLKLHLGDANLMEPDLASQRLGRKYLHEALESGLPPAETLYARALLAEHLNAATEALEQLTAAEMAPFHYRGNSCLLTCYLLAGRFAEARERTNFMARAFPDEPIVPLTRGLIATLEQDRPGIEQAKAALRQSLPPDQAHTLLAMMTTFEQIIQAGPQGANPAQLLQLVQPVPIQGVPFGRVSRIAGVGLPIWHLVYDSFQEMAATFVLIQLKAFDYADQRLQKSIQRSPEAFLRFQQAMVTVERLKKTVSLREYDKMIALSYQAKQQFEETIQAPTLFPHVPCKRWSRWLLLSVEVGLRQEQERYILRSTAAGIGWTPPLQPLGVLWMEIQRQQLFGAESTTASTLTSENFQELLRPHPKADSSIRPMMLQGLGEEFGPEALQLLLHAWIRDEPLDPRPREMLQRLKNPKR
jgi:tetratricopeptide (TPR) repeat protein